MTYAKEIPIAVSDPGHFVIKVHMNNLTTILLMTLIEAPDPAHFVIIVHRNNLTAILLKTLIEAPDPGHFIIIVHMNNLTTIPFIRNCIDFKDFLNH